MKLWLILSIASYSILECFPGAITEFSDSEVSVSIFYLFCFIGVSNIKLFILKCIVQMSHDNFFLKSKTKEQS